MILKNVPRKPIKTRVSPQPAHKNFFQAQQEDYDLTLKAKALGRTRERKAARLAREAELRKNTV